jgi:hypothetical protein
MDALVLLADIAAMQKPFPTLKERRLVFLERARLRMAQIRAQKGYVKPKPKPKKVVDPNWRHANIKKAQIALAKKRAYNKLMAQDTEEE